MGATSKVQTSLWLTMLGTKYFEVKTDTQAKDTGNVALEIQIVDNDGFKVLGVQ